MFLPRNYDPLICNMSRGGIDYSKWDKFQDSSDEDDDDDVDEDTSSSSLAVPRVTRLDQPSRITTQADGSMLIEQPAPPPVKEVKQLSRSSPSILQKQQQQQQQLQQQQHKEDQQTPSPPATWTEKGGSTTISVSFPTIATHNGASAAATTTTTVPIYWTQDRYSVTIRIGTTTTTTTTAVHATTTRSTCTAAAAAAANMKPRYQVQVTNMLSFADRHVATAQQQQPVLTIQQLSTDDGNMYCGIIQETLPYPVHRAAEDDDDDDDDENGSNNTTIIDWTLETWDNNNNNNNNCTKYLTITLYKAVPMQGLTLWWNRPFLSCPETDISSWRNKKEQVSSSSSSSGSFEQAWKEAHAMFQDKMKSQKEGRML